jgi:serine/threonine protein kinase
MRESAEALDLINSLYQLQHLDVKPQNLFLIHNHVKVADFGLIKDLKGTVASVTGGVTPVYAAPETFDGEVRRSTDQYSLAIVYQELLTGQRPFAGTTARQLVLQHIQAEPDLSALPPGDRPAVRRALSKNYAERYETCHEFVAALSAASPGAAASTQANLETPLTAPPPVTRDVFPQATRCPTARRVSAGRGRSFLPASHRRRSRPPRSRPRRCSRQRHARATP